jgi:hypothetical protein
MGKRYGAFLIALMGGLVLTLLAVRSVAAFSGVSGTVVDGKTGDPWLYGAEVAAYQLNAPFGPLGSTILDLSNGSFNLVYNVDLLGICPPAPAGCVPKEANAQIVLVVNFKCDLQSEPTHDYGQTRPDASTPALPHCPVDGDLGPLVGLPGGISYFYKEDGGPDPHFAGNLVTNTGPTAIALRSASAGPGGGMPVLLIATVFLLVGGASIIAVRRRR